MKRAKSPVRSSPVRSSAVRSSPRLASLAARDGGEHKQRAATASAAAAPAAPAARRSTALQEACAAGGIALVTLASVMSVNGALFGGDRSVSNVWWYGWVTA